MEKRKGISKKIRFEVFKRDSFTCQYCGASAPSVVLEIDHVKPVKQKGDNNILNLITSCFDCNRGKSDKTLSDNTVLYKQINQLKILEERRSQIEMMVKWKEEILKIDEIEVDSVINLFFHGIDDYKIYAKTKDKIKKSLKKFGFPYVVDCLTEMRSHYCGGVSNKDISLCFDFIVDYLGGCCNNKHTNQNSKHSFSYIYGILRNRFNENCKYEKALKISISKAKKILPDFEMALDIAKNDTTKSIPDFLTKLNEMIDEYSQL